MTDTPERSYDGCPREGLGYLHLWRAGVAYAELAETDVLSQLVFDVHARDVTTGDPIVVMRDADAMSFHHFFMFWGYVDGRL